MGLRFFAVTAICAVLLAFATASRAELSVVQHDPAALYQQPNLDGTSLAFAYDRLTGTTPDFRPYAEHSMPARNATAFDRDAVIARELARYQAAFQNLDLSKVYVVRLRAELQQYDPARGGYPLPLGEDSFVRLSDQATFKEYGFKLRNVGEINLIPVGNSTAARAFAARTNLATQGPYAAGVTVEMAVRLVEAIPALDAGAIPLVAADVLAARVSRDNGPVIYDFGLTATARRRQTGTGAANTGPATLKAADVQGIRLGMTQAEAEAIASRGWTTKRGSQQAGQVLWFNNLQPRQGDWAACANLTNSFPSPTEVMVGADPPSFKDCIGYGFARVGASNGPFGERVGQVASQQFLATGDATSMRRALEEKYGTPTIVRSGGNLIWIGSDPAQPDGGQIKVEARMGQENGSAAQNRFVLQISMEPYVDPSHPTPVAGPPAVAGGPRL